MPAKLRKRPLSPAAARTFPTDRCATLVGRVPFLEVDEDLLTAAGLSDQQPVKPDSKSGAKMDAWIAELPMAEKASILKLLLTGYAQHAERRLKLRFLAWQREQLPIGEPEPRRRTAFQAEFGLRWRCSSSRRWIDGPLGHRGASRRREIVGHLQPTAACAVASCIKYPPPSRL